MRDEILNMLLPLSDQQLDGEAKKRIRAIIGLSDDDAKKPLMQLLDLCVHCSWCSSFEINVLNILVDQLNITDEEKTSYRAELTKRDGNITMGKWESITLIALFICISFAMRGCAQMQVEIAKAKYQNVELSKERE